MLLNLFLMFFVYAQPNQLEIDSKVIYGGDRLASPRILTREGRVAKIILNGGSQVNEVNIEVHPKSLSEDEVSLKYSLSIKKYKSETLSRGTITLPLNENGLISLDKGRIQVYLKVKRT